MASKRRFIINGVAVSLETPHPPRGAPEEDMRHKKYLQVSYPQAIEHWGGSVATEIWRRLQRRETQARVTPAQFEELRGKPAAWAVSKMIDEIVARSQAKSSGRKRKWR